jgi:hypothetical protein
MSGIRWVVVALIVLVLVGLLAFARGRAHHHGDDEGASGASFVAVPVEV